jgi:ABC-type nitrate/sulfonate/bicarbonate transport system substrate-binding protein
MLSRSKALALLAGATALAPRALRAQAPVPLRVGTVLADSYAEPYYALDQGFFERAGFAAAAAGGSLDIGVADAVEIANGVSRGVPFQLIAGAGLYTSSAATTALCVLKDSPIAHASELEGQTVALISLVSMTTAGVKSWLTQNGADVAKIHFIELPYPQMLPALTRGTIAAATLGEPLLSAATSGAARVFGKVFDAIGTEFLISDWFSTRDWLGKNPIAAKRAVQVIYVTARWANTHHDESAVILAKYSKIDVDRIRQMNRCVYATNLQVGMVQPVLDAAFKYQALKSATPASSLIAKI